MKKALKITGRILLCILLAILLFLLGVFVYHRMQLRREKPLYAQPIGDMIAVDGGNMCVYSAGSGDHTIVFMSGYGTPSPILDFKPLYDKLTDGYRIAVAEKFGYGFSDETDLPRDVDTMLQNTRAALTGAGIEGPYILCPHSASGFEALYWAQTYPDEVEAITALDIAMPGYHEETGDSIFADRLMAFITNSGLLRLTSDAAMPWAYTSDALTDAEKAEYKAIMYARRGSRTMLHEAEYVTQNTETVAANPVPACPMLFLTSAQMAAQSFPQHPERYLDLAQRYTNNEKEYITLDYGHYLHVEAPDRVAAEMRSFIEAHFGKE